MTTEINTGPVERFRTLRRWSVILSLVPLPIWAAVLSWIHFMRPSTHIADGVGYTVLGAWMVLFVAAVLWSCSCAAPDVTNGFSAL